HSLWQWRNKEFHVKGFVRPHAPWGFEAMKTGSDSTVAGNRLLQRIRSLFELDCKVKICYSYL
ncbi:hypothetical protein A2U01_0091420, partial [Trifolium medium]|nr:hypothetical protein [Trifolium medium]